MKLVIAKELSDNPKIGPASATYASQRSCPTSCVLYNAGCYTENGRMRYHSKRIAGDTTVTPLDVAREEARMIRQNISGRYDMRLHVVGDCTSNEAADMVSTAALEVTRPTKTVWTYTHAWKDVEREAWHDVSVLASCETKEQVAKAQVKGFATALIVDEFKDDKLYNHNGVKLLPCPEQTRGVQCVSCGLCFNDKRLRENNITIGFAAHGSRKNLVKRTLTVLNQED